MMLGLLTTFSMVIGVGTLVIFHSSLFIGAYWFFAKQLYRDYEVKSTSIQYLFALAFTSCISMLQLLLLELLHILDPLVRRWIWSVDLVLVLLLVYVVLPVAFVYTIIGQAGTYSSRLKKERSKPVLVDNATLSDTNSSSSISTKECEKNCSFAVRLLQNIYIHTQRRYKELIGCFLFLPCVWLFFYKLGSTILFREPLQLSIASSTDQLLAYMGVCGVTIVSALAGFGSINFPYRVIHAHLYPIKQRDMVELEMRIAQILRLLSEKQGKCAIIRQSWRSTIFSLTPYIKEHWLSPIGNTLDHRRTDNRFTGLSIGGEFVPTTQKFLMSVKDDDGPYGKPQASTVNVNPSNLDYYPPVNYFPSTCQWGPNVDSPHCSTHLPSHRNASSTEMSLPNFQSNLVTMSCFSPPITSIHANVDSKNFTLIDRKGTLHRDGHNVSGVSSSSASADLAEGYKQDFHKPGIFVRLINRLQKMIANFLPNRASIQNSPKAEYNQMQAEIRALEKLLEEYTITLNSLIQQGIQQSTQANRPLYWCIHTAAGWLMTFVCIYRVSMACMNVTLNIWPFHQANASSAISIDPSTRILSAVFSLLNISTDISFWTPYVSMILMGWIIALNIRGFIEKALIAFRYLSTPISSNVLALIMSEVMCLYFSACALLMRKYLPLQYREAISEVLGQSLDFNAFHLHFDVVFVISCGVSLLMIILSQNFSFEKFKLL